MCDKQNRIKHPCSVCGKRGLSAVATYAKEKGWDLDKLELTCVECMYKKVRADLDEEQKRREVNGQRNTSVIRWGESY